VRIVLLYPPPWKLPGDKKENFGKEGAPPDFRPGDLDADFYQTPYGLFALGAATIRAGYPTKVLNLSSYPWEKVEEVIRSLSADVFGMSAWTANRRGVGYVAELIRKLHPAATIVVGGPHATPLAKEMVEHHPAIDLVCRGESDATLLEILSRKKAGVPLTGILGTAYRDASSDAPSKIVVTDEREQYRNLDDLACPQKYFPTHILMTSRGCPWSCTFCGAETSWGRGFRANSIDYVLDAMEASLATLAVKMIQIKDDTFTTNKKRVLELCQAIRKRGLKFLWSCDTRVDLLSDELLREMRLAGCQRLSLGVESGSQRILDAIEKKITPGEIIESSNLAKRYGIKIRYYMMLGNRGETVETFNETLAFLERAKPHEFVFSCLSIYPGTKDFYAAEKKWLDRQLFFRESFQEFKTPFDADDATTAHLNDWFVKNKGLQVGHRDGVAEYQAILERLPDHHAAHMDLGGALYAAGDLSGAERHVRRALELGYPLPGLVYNHLACIAKARGDLDGMMDFFTQASKVDPIHYVLIRNVDKARTWFKNGGYQRGEPLELEVRHDFQLLERTLQPALPGPLPEDYASWDREQNLAASAALDVQEVLIKTPEQEGSGKGLKSRLRVVT
jgi:anaerobic magnesium-protoporphyrin IX monomethyl ester cyclase